MTYKAPNPGEGWRLLKVGEVIPDGKVFWSNGDWVETTCGGNIHEHGVNAFLPMFYRTREGVKPAKERNPKPYTAKASITVPADYLKAEKWRSLALRMSKAKTIREARAIWKKGVGK